MKSSKLKLGLSLGCSLWLISCGQTPPPAPPPVKVSTPKAQPAEAVEAQAAAMAEAFRLEQLKTQSSAAPAAPLPIALDNEEQQQRDLLQEAIQLLAEQQQPERALAITHHLTQSTYGVVRQQNMLPALQAYLATRQYQALDHWLSQQQLTQVPAAQRLEFTQQVAAYYQQQQRLDQAVHWLLVLDELTGNQPEARNMQELLWQFLAQLNPADLAKLQQNARPRAAAWLELLVISQRDAGNSVAMQQSLQDWQLRHPVMPVLADLPSSINHLATITAYQPARVGVVLPLSGNFKALGEAIQAGLISATPTDRRLIFIDSAQTEPELVSALEQANVEFVIGPLLRDDVDRVYALEQWRWPTLFLNSAPADLKQAKPEQFFYALSAEDEAAQMVDVFRQKHYRHPVLISARHPISQRMAQHFQQLWQQQGGKVVESYSFQSQDELRGLINTFLETAASAERIKEIERFAGQSIKAEMHSRQDIDAIYLLADPAQARLVKPFIDVTVSPTAPRLPLYASSRSHSLAIDRTDIRDLSGLTFTEIPWLLPNPSTADLRKEFEQLFVEQEETLQRLFAMGHDAMQLISRLKQQQQFPALVYHGQTGGLKLGPLQNIQRQLTLAQYRNGRLIKVEAPQNRPSP